MSRKKVATPDDVKDIAFDPVGGKFEWTNDQWCQRHLVTIRLAIELLQLDSKTLPDKLREIVNKEGDEQAQETIFGFLDDLGATSKHLKALVEGLDACHARLLVSISSIADELDGKAA